MITLSNVSKSYGAQTLLEGASLQINSNDRYALVGPNGAGKSTLFKLLLGVETPDGGDIALASHVRIGHLPQETAALSNGSVLDEALAGSEYDPRGEAQAKKILMGLGFRVADLERPANTLSGGWQMRILIARLLVQSPDMLLLDEPTNHLDLESLLWFQDYLRHWKGSLFVISHDRAFINAVTSRIVEIDRARLKTYRGPYEAYLAEKAAEKERLIAAHKRQQKEIEELETYIARFRAKASLAASVQSKVKYLEKMERIEIPPENKTVGFSFPQPARSGVNVLTLKNVKKSYDGKTWIYDGLDLTLERGQRIAFVGPNGAGKSTLLKILAGVEPIQGGERKLGHNVESGYFSQHRSDMFKPGRTVYAEAADTRRAHGETTIRTVLGSFLFSDQTVFKKVEVLSGGEKSRLGLAKLLLDPPNLILMDEPTTHLDIPSVQTLVEALEKFEGTLCFISHDVHFLRSLANNVIHVKHGKVTWYPGGYDYFLERIAATEDEEGALFRSEQELESPKKKPAQGTEKTSDEKQAGGSGYKTKEQKRREAEERNARYRAAQTRKPLEDKLASLRAEETGLLAEMAAGDPARAKDLSRRLNEIHRDIAATEKSLSAQP